MMIFGGNYFFVVAAMGTLLVSSCTGPGQGKGSPLHLSAEGRPLEGNSSFASFEAADVRKAAMVYPAQTRLEEEAISLTADDGTGLKLELLHGKAVVEGPMAFTELHMKFKNPQARTIEGRFQITLPEGATVSRLAMRIKDEWREAEVVEKMAARRAYEDFLHRRQDPMLLEKEAGNQFRARIFPIPANDVKEVILSFSHILKSEEGYEFAMGGMPKIDDLRFEIWDAESDAKKTQYKRHAIVDARHPQPKVFRHKNTGVDALRHGSNFVARVQPVIAGSRYQGESMTILFDSSASRAPGFAQQVARLGTLVKTLSTTGTVKTIAVAAFDQEVVPIFSGFVSEFGDKQLQAILARRPMGASDLGSALQWAKTQSTGQLLIVGDMIVTAGESDVTAIAKGFPKHIERIDVLLTGGIRDTEAAGRLVRGTRAFDGVVLRDSMSDDEIARRLQSGTATVQVSVAGAKWSWPTTVAGVQTGDELVVYAGFANKVPQSIQVAVTGSKTIGPISPLQVPGPLIERAIIEAQIARLQSQFVEAKDKEKKALQAEIVRLSTTYRVLSEHTALLVLESESDYARFGISRTALADILTVDDTGLRVVQRNTVVAIAAQTAPVPRPQQPRKKSDAAGGTEPPPQVPQREIRSKNKRRGPARQRAVPSPAAKASVADDMMEEAEMDIAPAESSGAGRGRRVAEVAVADAVAAPEPSAVLAPPVHQGGAKKVESPPHLTGKMASVEALIATGNAAGAVVEALQWRSEEPGSVMALIALGTALEAANKLSLAARAYGSIIDLFPSRADLRRFAATRLARLDVRGVALSVDTLQRAVKQRPDHLIVHRLLAYALVRSHNLPAAFAAIEAGLSQKYPSNRFAGGARILREDLGIIASAWLAKDGSQLKDVEARLQKHGATLATTASTRFVLNWETDANDVDFHIYDGKGGHAYYSSKMLLSGGELFADVTNGYGPECFAIPGKAAAYPYKLQIHYYSRGPMGYGMGQLEILRHDGRGTLNIESRPFVVMTDGAYVDLGLVEEGSANLQVAH